mgnify:FL=1
MESNVSPQGNTGTNKGAETSSKTNTASDSSLKGVSSFKSIFKHYHANAKDIKVEFDSQSNSYRLEPDQKQGASTSTQAQDPSASQSKTSQPESAKANASELASSAVSNEIQSSSSLSELTKDSVPVPLVHYIHDFVRVRHSESINPSTRLKDIEKFIQDVKIQIKEAKSQQLQIQVTLPPAIYQLIADHYDALRKHLKDKGFDIEELELIDESNPQSSRDE